MFKYDRFQQEAIDHINNGHSVIVSAPTGAGKTAIAEHVIDTCINNNTGVIYTAPIKALSNQKFRDFQNRLGDNIGILTGDISLNPEAPVLIMTTEIFRNKILDDQESLKKYRWIIFDEVHYLDNEERGTVWEESLIFLPSHMNLLALSATIPNIKQIAEWIESIHNKPVQTVVETERPVPLHFLFQCQNQVVDSLPALKNIKGLPELPYKFHRQNPRTGYGLNKIGPLIKHIREREGFPCIYFVFGRRRAEYLAKDLCRFDLLPKDDCVKITSLYEELCRKFDLTRERSAQEMSDLVKKGIAFHHAGMLPTLKEVIERLFTSRLLKVIFTTETFALGINMPSRSVVFDDLRKFYGRYVRNLKTRDFYQMAGRAGRRGIDTEGFVYCRINPAKLSYNDINRVIYGGPEEVHSQLNTSYATILNLYEKYRDDLYKVYPLSLHYFQCRKEEQKEALRLIEAKLNLLKDNDYIKNGELTPKGQFAKTVYGYELLLSELYERNVLEQLDEFGLGIMAAAAVFEPRKNQQMLNLSKSARRIRAACEEIYARIKQLEISRRIYPLSKEPYFHLSGSIESWLRGTSFEKTLLLTDTDEGEIVRYFRMSVQILREIGDSEVASPLLKEKIRETARVINRDIIDAEKQLRET